MWSIHCHQPRLLPHMQSLRNPFPSSDYPRWVLCGTALCLCCQEVQARFGVTVCYWRGGRGGGGVSTTSLDRP